MIGLLGTMNLEVTGFKALFWLQQLRQPNFLVPSAQVVLCTGSCLDEAPPHARSCRLEGSGVRAEGVSSRNSINPIRLSGNSKSPKP